MYCYGWAIVSIKVKVRVSIWVSVWFWIKVIVSIRPRSCVKVIVRVKFRVRGLD